MALEANQQASRQPPPSIGCQPDTPTAQAAGQLRMGGGVVCMSIRFMPCSEKEDCLPLHVRERAGSSGGERTQHASTRNGDVRGVQRLQEKARLVAAVAQQSCWGAQRQGEKHPQQIHNKYTRTRQLRPGRRGR